MLVVVVVVVVVVVMAVVVVCLDLWMDFFFNLHWSCPYHPSTHIVLSSHVSENLPDLILSWGIMSLEY